MFPTIKLNIERWKYNPTFELYVSNMGHIRNKSKADIAPKIMQNGYVVVYVYGSLNKYMLLHRVVMLTWKPTPEAEELTVDHLDHNKRNNALSNLEWVTQEENSRRAAEDYVACSTLVGNDVIVSEKKEKQKRDLTVDYFYISGKDKFGKTIKPFTLRVDYSDLAGKMAALGHKLNNYSETKMAEIMEKMINGVNVNGYKEYCRLKIRAVAKDKRFFNNQLCPLQKD